MSFLKSAERSGKKILAAILKIFVSSDQIKPDQVNLSEIKKILIVHQDRKIGNFILTTPLLISAKNNFPGAQIDILLSKNNRILCENFPGINEIYSFDHKGFIKNPFRFFRLISHLRKKNYSLAVESSKPGGTSFLNGLITYFTTAGCRVGFEGGSGSIFTNIHVIPDYSKHYYSMKQELLNIFLKEKKYYKPRIFSDETETEKMKEFLKKKFSLKKDSKVIGIWIGARHNKKWDIKNFRLLYSKIISEKNFPVLAFGIEEENEYKKTDKNSVNSILLKDLKKLKSFISACSIFICGDTGPLHFSFALEVPTIGIFLQDNYTTYGYAEDGNNLIVTPDNDEEMIRKILEGINIISERKSI